MKVELYLSNDSPKSYDWSGREHVGGMVATPTYDEDPNYWIVEGWSFADTTGGDHFGEAVSIDVQELVERAKSSFDKSLNDIVSMAIPEYNLIQVDNDYYFDIDPEELGAAITSLLGEVPDFYTEILDSIIFDATWDKDTYISKEDSLLESLSDRPEDFINSICDISFDEMNEFQRIALIYDIREYITENA